MRAPLPSVAGVLRNVPDMPSVLYPQRQRAAQPSDAGLMFSTDGGNGTGNPFGLVGSRRAPAMEDPRIAALDSRIDSYMSSGSIFDMWRGRQLMKRRDALARNVLDQQQLGQQLGQQEKNAALQFRGTQLSADAQRYATDVGARERKYVADVGAMTREREMQAGLLPHMADIQMGKRIERLIKEGRYEEAKMLKTLGAPSQPRTAAQPTLDVTGGKGLFVGIDPATNKPYAVSGEQLLQQQLEEERNRRREALAGGR